jgi:DNA ligase-1
MKPEDSMMHGSDYTGQNPKNWVVTEKFDGFFARWTGAELFTREGKNYNAPKWFTVGLPAFALDCELFAGNGQRFTLNCAHRWTDKRRWGLAELIVFDAPSIVGCYENRHNVILKHTTERAGLRIAERWTCSGMPGLLDSLTVVKRRGGEGLVIRHPDALYEIGRTQTMLKVKPEFIQQNGKL